MLENILEVSVTPKSSKSVQEGIFRGHRGL
jgi:hypothetical protein